MNGKTICLVGETRVGKTTFVKEKIKASDKPLIGYCRIRQDLNLKGKIYTDFSAFIQHANRVTNHHLFIDEAFTCMPEKLLIKPDKPENIHNQIADMLVNAPKLNNWVWIIFHGLNQVPTRWLLMYLNYFARFQTNDEIDVQLRRFRTFPAIVKSLETYPEIPKFECDIIKIR